MEVKPRRKKH